MDVKGNDSNTSDDLYLSYSKIVDGVICLNFLIVSSPVLYSWCKTGSVILC
jgi:hypothetical protein